jgi:hypothetical protein
MAIRSDPPGDAGNQVDRVIRLAIVPFVPARGVRNAGPRRLMGGRPTTGRYRGPPTVSCRRFGLRLASSVSFVPPEIDPYNRDGIPAGSGRTVMGSEAEITRLLDAAGSGPDGGRLPYDGNTRPNVESILSPSVAS